MVERLTDLLTREIRETILDIPAGVIIDGIVSEIGVEETVQWLQPLAKAKGYTITIERSE